MSKFYRVKKDTPAWSKGAILKQLEKDREDEKAPNYEAISDLWETFEKDYPTGYQEFAGIIENRADWFERVYDVKVLGKLKYLTKAKAQEAHDQLYKEG